jgi:hypothetical protein
MNEVAHRPRVLRAGTDNGSIFVTGTAVSARNSRSIACAEASILDAGEVSEAGRRVRVGHAAADRLCAQLRLREGSTKSTHVVRSLLSDEDVQVVLHKLIDRILKMLTRRGALGEEKDSLFVTIATRTTCVRCGCRRRLRIRIPSPSARARATRC